MKRSLHRIIFRASVTFEELLTVITEIEAVMNSRPLTYISGDVAEVLTPGHLLIGKRILESNISPMIEGDDCDQVRLTNRAKYLKTINEHYWTRWRNEYLVELRCVHSQGDSTPVISVGEVVLINDKLKRNKWKMVIIVKLLDSTDTKVRAVVVKTLRNDNKITFLKRPIEKLYPLEVRCQEDVTASDLQLLNESGYDEDETKSDTEGRSDSSRPRRIAADNGILIRRLLGN